jgi:replication factor A1
VLVELIFWFVFAVKTIKPGTAMILRNAKIDMFKGTMRLAVDKWGRVKVTELANFEVLENYVQSFSS